MENLVLKSEELKGLEESKALKIQQTFEPLNQSLVEMEEEFNAFIASIDGVITEEICKEARNLRLKIRDVRTNTENVRKKEKAEYIRVGKAIDGISNIIKYAVSEKEEKLKSIENHFEILEQERKAKLQAERVELLKEFVEDAEERDLSSMEEDVWEAYLTSKKQAYFDMIKAERKAEEERLKKQEEEAKERERIRLENEKLKKEAEEREKLAQLEREKQAKLEAEKQAKEEAERKKIEEERRKEREAHEAKLKAEREEREKQARIEEEKRKAIEAKLKAKEEEERKRKAEKEAMEQAKLSMGDKEKFNQVIESLENIKLDFSFESKEYKRKHLDVCVLIDKIIKHVKK